MQDNMKNQRKKHYISRPLQGNLIIAFVALESLLLAVTMIYLYTHFNAMIEHDLYAIHRSSQTDLLIEFMKQIGISAFGLLSINALLLSVALYFWSKQIRSILISLRESLERISSLNFRAIKPVSKPAHELQAVLHKWISIEKKRIGVLKHEISGIEIKSSYSDSDLQLLRGKLRQCKRHLEIGDITAE